jgi:hypothetical protein
MPARYQADALTLAAQVIHNNNSAAIRGIAPIALRIRKTKFFSQHRTNFESVSECIHECITAPAHM